MSEAAKLDLSIERTSDYVRHSLALLDLFKNPIDVTGWAFEMRINVAPGLGDPALLQLTGIPTANGSYITPTYPTGGLFELYIDQGDIAILPGALNLNSVLAHNIYARDAANQNRVIARGRFIIEPGV